MNVPPTLLVTGGTGGIGFQSALGLARGGADVVITGRNATRGEAARDRIIAESGNPKVRLVTGDLSSIAGIDTLAKRVLGEVGRLDVLVNNAGYLGNTLQHSADDLEMHFAVNVLAPWRLTRALLPAFQAAGGGRVLNVSGGEAPDAIDPDNLQAERGFKGLNTYKHSKSVMEAMSLILARDLEAHKVWVNLVFPGRASTAMTRSLSAAGLPGALKLMLPLFKLLFSEDGGKSAAKAARSSIWAATTPDLEGVSGRYFDTNCAEQPLHPSAYAPPVQARILAALQQIEAQHPPQGTTRL